MFQNAKAIWLNQPVKENTYALFKGEFDYQGGEIRLLIAADSHYAVYLNGEYVYSQQFADDEGRRVYDVIDLSESVRPGKNDLLIGGYCTLTDSSVYKAGKLVSPGKGKPVKGAKPAAGKGKSAEPSRSEKKTAKPVRKEGWAKPKDKRSSKK